LNIKRKIDQKGMKRGVESRNYTTFRIFIVSST